MGNVITPIAIDNPNYFQIGNIVLSVPVQNIEIARHENFQVVSYLRDIHAMRLNTGRSMLRVDISFPILMDIQVSQLQALVAMTRVTPFVPVQNKHLQAQLQIYDVPPKSFNIDHPTTDDIVTNGINERSPVRVADQFVEDTDPTFLEALPMAILGMSVMMGGDSPDIAECHMTLLYWNPYPWFGRDLQYWKMESLVGLNIDYSRYLRRRVKETVPDDFNDTIMRWWDVRLYSELVAQYSAQLAEVDDQTAVVQNQEKQIQSKPPELETDPQFNALDSYAKYLSKRITPQELAEGIASAETGGLNLPWSQINDNTQAAGRYQMRRATFSALFFNGADTADGVPLRQKLKDRWSEFVPANSTNTLLEDMVFDDASKSRQYYEDNFSKIRNDDDWARWYSQNDMQGVQTFITQEYLRGLMNKHDGDAVSASMEYFLGARNAIPYINEWKKSGIIKGWEANDVQRIGSINTPLRKYLAKVLNTFNTNPNGQYTVSIDRQLVDPINYDRLGPDTIPRNRFGQRLGGFTLPNISLARRQKLRELGWDQLSVLSDGRPNPDLRNPLFYRVSPNIIDLTPNGIVDAENQVITSISVSFQNRFASLPIQGWPYPALQHMGSIDSEMRMTVVCLSDSQQYRVLKQAQQMLHSMSTRGRKYRASIFSGRDILVLNKVNLQNRLVNILGVNDVIVSDVSVQTDSESPDMVRGEIIMTETALDPDKEELRAGLGKNDQLLRKTLLNNWLQDEKFNLSKESTLREIGLRLRSLQLANDAARATNRDILTESGQVERVIVDTFNENDDFRRAHPLSVQDTAYLRKLGKQLERFGDIVDSTVISNRNGHIDATSDVKMRSAQYIPPTDRVLFARLRSSSPEQLKKLVTINVPVDPDSLISESLLDRISIWLESFYRTSEEQKNIDPNEVDRLRGQAAALLSTSVGVDILDTWTKLKQAPDLTETFDLTKKFFGLWIEGLWEWYNTNVLESILITLFKSYPNDESFEEIRKLARSRPNSGIYRDLFLDEDPDTNPYEWLDNIIEPQVQKNLDDLYQDSRNRINIILDQYKKTMRDTGPNALPLQIDAGASRIINDQSRDIEAEYRDTISAFQKSVDANIAQGNHNIELALQSMKFMSTVPFTMKRAFPAFRLYFVEEDNQGIFKRFDDFYNYNAIVDIQMIKYKYRSDVMVITMTNLFGHLDGTTFNDRADRDALAEAVRKGLSADKTPTQITEQGREGVEKQVSSDGTESPLREIMLQPGTKVVMKMGYDNDPDNLPTVFAGQITEVTTGEIVTIVCQDWTSELYVGASIDDGIPSKVGFLKRYGFWPVGNDDVWDIQGTVAPRRMLESIVKHRSAQHFGHWQIGNSLANANHFGYRSATSLTLKPFDGLISKFITQISAGQLSASSRATINIYPQSLPYYTAFGIDNLANYPTKNEIVGMNLWELVQLVRLQQPNHLALVRPYGQGDATLYFGPPWGVYQANEFEDNIESTISENEFRKYDYEIFEDLIRNSATISIGNLDALSNREVGRNVERIFSRIGAQKSQGGSQVPIWLMLTLLAPELFGQADETTLSRFWNNIKEVTFDLASITGHSSTAALAEFLRSREMKEIYQDVGVLHPAAERKVITAYWHAIRKLNSSGHAELDDQRDELLIITLAAVAQAIQAWMLQKSINDPTFDKNGTIRKAVKPARRWHMLTAKHHIIQNNIQLNSNFANEVRAHKHVVRFDRELTEIRTRHFDAEIPASTESVPLDFMLSSLLADELRSMYMGELIVTGNSEIWPHDIILIFDDIRNIFGAVEVAKVQHTFNQDIGFISIIQPHLIVEVGDFSISTALGSFFQRVQADLAELEGTKIGNVATGVTSGITSSLLSSLSPVLGYNSVGQGGFFILSQLLARNEARNHPLTIFPLVKKSAPWLAGIEGASGRGLVGFFGQEIIGGIRNIRQFVKSLRTIPDFLEDAGALFEEFQDGLSPSFTNTPKSGRFK